MGDSVSDKCNGKDRILNLIAARKSLKLSLDKSKALGSSLEKAGPRLDEINQRLPSLEAAVRPIRADKDALAAVGGHINRAVGPAAAVLKVFDAVHGLEKSLLSDPKNDLSGYLSVLKRLEEALRFLGDNCGLAIQWLEDIVEYLEDNTVADERYLSNLKKSLKSLRELQNEDKKASLDGGLLDAALDKLEGEFRRLLTEHSVPLPMSSPPSLGQQAVIAPSPLPVSVIQKLQAILGRLIANNRLEKCISIYVEVRGSNVRASLQALDLDYLEISIAEFNDVQSIEVYIAKWGKHLEFAVKHLFEAEYKLCNDVFERIGLDVWMGCFAKIAAQAGILAFLQFGKTVTESKKDPIKLLKLLDIFTSLNKLRLDFNRLFGGAACMEIQNLTRDLIKRVIDGAAEIFWELLLQVELQRQIPPPPDGGVPRLVSFITDYCNKLIGDDYKPILTQVLLIHRSWKHERFQERLLFTEVLNIIKAIELNLETWTKAYEDAILSNLFAMNNHYHLYKHLKGTKLGDLLGDSWLREHEQYKDYYATIFLRDSWGKLPGHLSREGLILFSGGRATARDLVKKRLKNFNEAFDEMYKKQSNWVMPERDLREKTCQLIVQAVVPVYRSYMQNYGPLVEQDGSSSKYAKYSVQTLEHMLASLFQPRPGRYGSFKGRQLSDKFNNGVADLRRTASAVV
ncbi:exocyst complex component EXO70A1 [Ricinus communis]|uniref:Exocyst subunit Exo70 family protein n=1 Tax=Ricinus communis TaxID=3988 RepID=B9RNN3_RICCO|nr:exocyst complex component EXO70A1 [Ricinus communis]EEF46801.1 protein binding protein, putative [Ricinus communis]|eukprot:XP_002515352.1 exocyst complex component EXO70A1 [Ricinus communis]